MIIECACKKYKFAVKAEEIGINGRVDRNYRGHCNFNIWFNNELWKLKILKEIQIKEEEEKKKKPKIKNQ